MTITIYNSWGRKIAEQESRHAWLALDLMKLYSTWETVIVTTASGRPVEMFVRL